MISFLCCFIRIKGSVKRSKRSAESYNEQVSHLPKQPPPQHDATQDIYTNMSTPSSKLSVINDDVNAYEFNSRKMGYAIFIINSEFDDQKTRPVADLDCCNMSEVFLTLGFDIKILENKTNSDLKESLAGMYARCQSLSTQMLSH